MPWLFLLASIQVFLTFGAGWLLWMIWRRLAAWSARAGLLIGIGLVARAFMAQAMFWISYLHLPIARPLQDGEGFWNLAIDGHLYFVMSQGLLTQGWKAVVLVDKTLPSPAFLQVLAVFILLFGGAAAVGAFLNLFAYLGACAAILRLGRTEDGLIRPSALVAAGALSFAPAVILWSAQPLKDPFFIFAVAAFVAASAMWQDAWIGLRQPLARFVVPLLLMAVVLYSVVGVRWYFGLILWFASAPFFVIAAWRSDRRLAAGVCNAAVFVALSQVILFAGRPYVPPQVARLLGARTITTTEPLTTALLRTRAGFDASHGNSMIQEGSTLRRIDPSEGGAGPAAMPGDGDSDSKPVTESPGASQAPSLTHEAIAREPPRTVRTAAAGGPGAGKNSAIPPPAPTVATSKSPAPAPTAATSKSPAPAPVVVARPAGTVAKRRASRSPASGVPGMPRSTVARIVAGVAAVVLPHMIGEWLGLIHIGGGRGLWAIVEIDTLVFDFLLIAAAYYVFRGLSRGVLRNGSFWLVAVMTPTIMLLLCFTISNFGTLFRHRAMILMGLCLLIAVAGATTNPRQPDDTSARS